MLYGIYTNPNPTLRRILCRKLSYLRKIGIEESSLSASILRSLATENILNVSLIQQCLKLEPTLAQTSPCSSVNPSLNHLKPNPYQIQQGNCWRRISTTSWPELTPTPPESMPLMFPYRVAGWNCGTPPLTTKQGAHVMSWPSFEP